MAEHLQPRPPALAAEELGLLPCLLPALRRQREHGKWLRHTYACVSIGEHTHTQDLFASKTIFNDLVVSSYMHLAWTCVTEINYWQRNRARAAWKHIPSAVVFIDICSLFFTVYFCSHGLLGPVSYWTTSCYEQSTCILGHTYRTLAWGLIVFILSNA